MGIVRGMDMMSQGEQSPRDDGSEGRTDAAASGSGESSRGLNRAMRITAWVVGGVVALGLIVALALVLSPPAGQQTAGTPSSTASPTRGPNPEGTPVPGSEVQTPDPSAPNPDRLPPRDGGSPLVEPPFPPSGSAEGSLVDGFPVQIMGPTSGSDVLSSSIATQGDTMQVTVVARSDESREDVLAHFSRLWRELGLAESPGSDTSALSAGDGSSSLSLAFTSSSGTGTVYMVYGVFRTS